MRPLRPLSHFLPKQRPGFASDAVVPQSRAIKTFAPENHVHAKWHLLIIKRNRHRPVVKQSDHSPMLAAAIRQPVRTFPRPDRQRLSTKVITLQFTQSPFGIRQPLRLDPYVVVRDGENLALRSPDTGVQRCGASLFLFEDVTEGNGKRLYRLDHFTG